METIYQRVSIRKYKDTKVEREKIEALLRAGMAAPSAGNQQPWEFYVVENKAKIEELETVSPYAKCLKNAPLAIVPVYRKKGLRFDMYADIDMSICCENMWLEATSLGLGFVWLGISPLEDRMEAVEKVLGLPEDVRAFAILSIGYPDEEKKQQDRFEENRIHYIL